MKIPIASHNVRTMAVAVLTLGLSPLATGAEDFAVSKGAVANLPEGVQESVNAQAQQFATGMLNQMMLKIDEVNRVCTLSGAQRIKLKVAAKGAVEYAIQNWIDATGQQYAFSAAAPAGGVLRPRAVPGQPIQVNVAPAPVAAAGRRGGRGAAPVAAEAGVAGVIDIMGANGARRGRGRGPAAEEAQAAAVAAANDLAAARAEMELAQRRAIEVQQQFALQQQQQLRNLGQQPAQVVEEVVVNVNGVNQVVRRVRRAPAMVPADMNAAEVEHIWTSALDNTLSAEQKQLLTNAKAERTAGKQEGTATARVVSQIDDWLLLDTSQREKVTELVGKTLELPTFRTQAQRTPQLSPAIIDRVIKRIPAAEMTALLTPTQLTRWQQALQSSLPQANNAAPPMQAPGAFNGELFVPAGVVR